MTEEDRVRKIGQECLKNCDIKKEGEKQTDIVMWWITGNIWFLL